ncbi:MAG: TetR/AcrR family transcriptional regulator [Spirochaetota bacterium]
MLKTRRTLQSEQTRERIIATATRLFIRKGFYATSIADLARSVKVTKGALYHHFENKDAIFFAVIETIRKTWKDGVARGVLKSKDALTRLAVLLDNHARLMAQNETFCLVLNSLMMEMEGVNPAFIITLQEIYVELVRFIEQIIRKGQTARQIRSDLDAKLTAFHIVGMLRGTGCSRPIFARLDVDYLSLIETLKKVLLSGLKP